MHALYTWGRGATIAAKANTTGTPMSTASMKLLWACKADTTPEAQP